jgi:hypothetical protein
MSNLVNGVFQVVANEFPEVFNNAPPGSITPKKVQTVIDKLEDLVYDHLGEGPITLGVAHELNLLHAEGREWQVIYFAGEQKFVATGQSERGGLEHVKNDSLYEAIRGVRREMMNEERHDVE